MRRLDRRGTTLVELLVALAIIAVTLALATTAFRGPAARAPARAERIRAARQRALRMRRPVPFVPGPGEREMLALPDGRILGDSSAAFDPLTGGARASGG